MNLTRWTTKPQPAKSSQTAKNFWSLWHLTFLTILNLMMYRF